MKRIFPSFGLLFLSALTTFANEAVSTAEEAISSGPTFMELFQKGGSLMWVLLAISIFAIAMVVYLAFSLREGVTAPRALVNDVMDKLQKGEFEEARKVCDYRMSPFSKIVIAAVDSASNLSERDNKAVVLNNVIAGEGARQAERVNARAQWLLDVATISPMVGLLGTVMGMLTAFQGVGGNFAVSARPVVLAQGVSFALITTIAGLIIAIPSMVLYAVFRRKAARQQALLECHAHNIEMAILSRR